MGNWAKNTVTQVWMTEESAIRCFWIIIHVNKAVNSKVANDLSRHFYNIFFPFQVTLLIIWLLKITENSKINWNKLEAALHWCSYKRCYVNMQQIYRRTPMPRCNFNKVVSNFIEFTLYHECLHVNLLHIFKTSLPENTSEGLLLNDAN